LFVYVFDSRNRNAFRLVGCVDIRVKERQEKQAALKAKEAAGNKRHRALLNLLESSSRSWCLFFSADRDNMRPVIAKRQ
jgi:hypothetical protein